MDINEKKAIVTRADHYGIDASGLGSRSLKVIEALMNYLEEKVNNYIHLREELDNYLNRYYTETAISQATGLSRGNISRNALYKALIAAIKPPVSSEVHLTPSEYQRIMNELKTLREWRDNEVLRQIKLAKEKKAAQTLLNENENAHTDVQSLTDEVILLREELKTCKKIIDEKKLVINVNSPFGDLEDY